MCADHDIDATLFQAFEDATLFSRRTITRQHFDSDRELRHPLAEGAKMLFGQNCRRDQNGHLSTIINGLEDRPHRDFRFSEADVPADQAVHRLRLFHIAFQVNDCGSLIRSFCKRKRFLKLLLQMRVCSTLKPGL